MKCSISMLCVLYYFSDEFFVSLSLGHDAVKSQAIAYNVTIEYYLPPYVTYVSEHAPSSPDVVKVTGTRYEVKQKIISVLPLYKMGSFNSSQNSNIWRTLVISPKHHSTIFIFLMTVQNFFF